MGDVAYLSLSHQCNNVSALFFIVIVIFVLPTVSDAYWFAALMPLAFFYIYQSLKQFTQNYRSFSFVTLVRSALQRCLRFF